MRNKAWYPEDYLSILHNTLTSEEITHHLQTPHTESRFLYGALMVPTVLKYFLHADQTFPISPRMTPAKLAGYRLYQFSTTSTPVIVPDSTSMIEGILVLGLDEAQRNAIHEVEAGLTQLAWVEVQITERQYFGEHEYRCIRLVDTGTFVWKGSSSGLFPSPGVSWCLDGFLMGSFYRHIVQSQQRDALDRRAQSESRDEYERLVSCA